MHVGGRTMAKLLRMWGSGREQAAVRALLTRLDRQRTPLRMEIENSLIRFTTALACKRGTVVVAKPPALDGQRLLGATVRFHPPGEPERALRMKVAVPHFNLANGQPAFLCDPPTGFTQGSGRQSERHDTRRFRNLLLHIPALGAFPVLDLSASGCRVESPSPDPAVQFPLDEPLGAATLQLGRNARVEVAGLVPRSHNGRTVGLELLLEPGGRGVNYLEHLLRSLERTATDSMRAEPL